MYRYLSRITIFIVALYCLTIGYTPVFGQTSRRGSSPPQQKDSNDGYTIKSTFIITIMSGGSGTFLGEVLIPLGLSRELSGFVDCNPNQRPRPLPSEWQQVASIQPRGNYCEFKFSLKFSNLDMLNNQFTAFRGGLSGAEGKVIQENKDNNNQKDTKDEDDEEPVTIRITRSSTQSPLDPYTKCRVIVKIPNIQRYTGKEIATYDEKAGQIAWDFPKTGDFKVEVSTGSLIYGRLRVVDPKTKESWNIDKIAQSTTEAEKTTIKVFSKDSPNSQPVMELTVKENGKFSSRESIKGSEKDLKDGKEYILQATLAYKDYSTIDNTNNLYIGKLFIDRTGGSPPQKGYTPRNSRRDKEIAIDRQKSTEPINIDYPLPIVLIHGIRSYWDDWKWFTAYLPGRKNKNSGLYNGFIVFTPTYKFRAGDKTTDTDEEIEEVRQLAVNQVNDQITKAFGGLFSTRPKANFICHSNGGVIARVFSEKFSTGINKIYTLGSPHSGTTIFEAILPDFGIPEKYGLGTMQMGRFNLKHRRFNNYVFAIGGNANFGLNDGVVAPQESVFNIGYFNLVKNEQPLFPNSRPPRLADHYNKYKYTFNALQPIENRETVPFYHSQRAGHPSFLDEEAIMIFEDTIFKDMEYSQDLSYVNPQAYSIVEVSSKNNSPDIVNLSAELGKATVIVPDLIELQKNLPQEINIPIPLTSELTVSFLTNGSVQLIDPNRTIIGLESISSYSGAAHNVDYYGQHIITIKNPIPGNWILRVSATSENTGAIVGAAVKSDWELSGEIEKESYSPSSKILIRSAPLGNYTKPKITSITVTLKNKSGEVLGKSTLSPSKISEYVYESYLTAPAAVGQYWLYFEAKGTEQGMPIKQQDKAFFYVGDKPVIASEKSNETFAQAKNSYQSNEIIRPNQGTLPAPTPQAQKTESFTFSLNGNLKTDVQVNAGDTVMLSASGSVLIIKRPNPISSAPDGIKPTIDQIFGLIVKTAYQGALLARVTNKGDEKWIVVGSGKTFIAPNSGVLELQVNDKKYQDNEGKFDVQVKIDRK